MVLMVSVCVHRERHRHSVNSSGPHVSRGPHVSVLISWQCLQVCHQLYRALRRMTAPQQQGTATQHCRGLSLPVHCHIRQCMSATLTSAAVDLLTRRT